MTKYLLNNYFPKLAFIERDDNEGGNKESKEKRKNVTQRERAREAGWEIKLRSRRERRIASALVCHLYDLSVRELVKLNSGVVWSSKSHFPIRAIESYINKLQQYFLYKKTGWVFSNCAVKRERWVVYACDRVFTLSSSSISSDGENARPPTALLLSHHTSVYLSVCLWGVSLMGKMCLACVVFVRVNGGKCQPVLCPHYNQLNPTRAMSSKKNGRQEEEKNMTNGYDSNLLFACTYESYLLHLTHIIDTFFVFFSDLTNSDKFIQFAASSAFLFFTT